MAKIRKSKLEQLEDLEAHLLHLHEACALYRAGEKHRFKPAAGILRMLVVGWKNNTALLLDLMDEFTFSYEVKPPGPPFDKGPIPTTGWRTQPQFVEMTAALQSRDHTRIAAAEAQLRAIRRPLPLREFIEEGLAMDVLGKDLSYHTLVRAIAEKLGGSHEDKDIDEEIAFARSAKIGNEDGHLAPMMQLAELVIDAGEAFIIHIVESIGYQPRILQYAGPTSTPKS